jgi:hypothetical protein
MSQMDELVIKFGAEDMGLEGQLLQLQSSLAANTEALTALTVKLGETAGASDALAAGAGNATRAASAMGTVLAGVSTEAGAATKNIAGMGGALSSLGAMTGPMLALGAALAAIGTVVAGFAGGIKYATDMRDAMETLKFVTADYGGNVAAVSKQVADFANLQEQTTRYAAPEVVASYNIMNRAITDTGDALNAVRIAEDVARKTHNDLITTTEQLMKSETGRKLILAELGIKISDIKAQHMSWNDVMKLAEAHSKNLAVLMSGELPDSIEMTNNAWKHSWSALAEDLLPTLTSLSDHFRYFIEDILPIVGHSFVLMFNSIKEAAASDLVGVAKFFMGDYKGALADFGHGESAVWNALTTEVAPHFETWQARQKHLQSQNAPPSGDPFKHTYQMSGTGGSAASVAAAAAKALRQDLRDLETQYDTLRTHAGQSFDTQIEETKKEIAALKEFAETHKLTRAEMDQVKTKIKDLENAEESLKKKREEAHTKHLEALKKEYEALVQHYDALISIAKDTYGKESTEYINALRAMQAALTDFLKKHKDLTQQVIDDAHVKYAQMGADYQTVLDTEQKQYDEWVKKQEEAAKQHYDQLHQIAQQWADKVGVLFDSIFTGGKTKATSFKDEFLKILHEIEQALMKSMLVKMFMGALGGVGGPGGSFLSMLGMGGGGGGGGGGGLSLGASQNGLLGALVGTAGASSVVSSLPQNQGVMGMLFGSSASNLTTGGGGGGGGGLAALAALFGHGGGGGGGSGSGSTWLGGVAPGAPIASGFGPASIFAPNAAAGKGVGEAMGALAGGGLAFQGMQQGGAFGGLESGLGIDMLLTSIGVSGGLATPIAIAAGLAAMFMHHDNPAQMPDKYMPGYGQFVSDINGAGGTFNGQFIQPEAQYWGSNALRYQIAAFFGSNPDLTQYGPNQGALEQLKALGPTYGIANEKNGTFTLDDGRTVGVNDYISLVSTYIAAVGSSGIPSPVFKVTHSLPDYAGAVSGVGNYLPGSPAAVASSGPPGNVTGSGGAAAPTVSASAMRVVGAGGGGAGGDVYVTQHIYGSILQQKDLAQYLNETLNQYSPARGMNIITRS